MIVVFSKNNCPECAKAISLLESKGLTYQVEKVEDNEAVRPFLMSMGHRALPQIYDIVGEVNTYIGDYKKLKSLTDDQLAALKQS